MRCVKEGVCMLRRVFAIIVVCCLFVSCCGCVRVSKMPFNGDISFHDITMTIPTRFIRDSTQSSADLWIFEQGNYSEYIIISRKDIAGDVSASLSNYAEYMKERNADSNIVPFLGNDAVLSMYYIDNVYCQEILFPYKNSFYAIALRGGTESGFNEITATIMLKQASV